MTDNYSPTKGENSGAPLRHMTLSYSSRHSPPGCEDTDKSADFNFNSANLHKNESNSTDHLQSRVVSHDVEPATCAGAPPSVSSDIISHSSEGTPVPPQSSWSQSTNTASNQATPQPTRKRRKGNTQPNITSNSCGPPPSIAKNDIANMQNSIQDLYMLQRGNIMFMNSTVAVMQELKELLSDKQTQNHQLQKHYEKLLLKHEELLERQESQVLAYNDLREESHKKQELHQEQLNELREQVLRLKMQQYKYQRQPTEEVSAINESDFLAQLEEQVEHEIVHGELDDSQLAVRKEKLGYIRLLQRICDSSTACMSGFPDAEEANAERIISEQSETVAEDVIMEGQPDLADFPEMSLLRRKHVLNIKRYCNQRERSILRSNQVLRAFVASEVEGLRDWYLAQPGRVEGGDAKQRLLRELRDKMYNLKSTCFSLPSDTEILDSRILEPNTPALDASGPEVPASGTSDNVPEPNSPSSVSPNVPAPSLVVDPEQIHASLSPISTFSYAPGTIPTVSGSDVTLFTPPSGNTHTENSLEASAINFRVHYAPEDITLLDSIFKDNGQFRELFEKDIEQVCEWYNNDLRSKSDTQSKQILLNELTDKLREVKNKVISSASAYDSKRLEERTILQKRREVHKLKRTSPHPYEDTAVPFPVMPLGSGGLDPASSLAPDRIKPDRPGKRKSALRIS